MISSDSHAAARLEEYQTYLDPQYRERFDEWAPKFMVKQGDFLDEEFMKKFDEAEAVTSGGESGSWDFDRRIGELEADGCVGEIIFPNPGNIPFGFGFGPGNPFNPTGEIESPELRQAGARAYGRWLADRCSQNPGRHAGVIPITLDDIEGTVKDVRAFAEAGARGGILVPEGRSDWPLYNHERYEPIWSLCEEMDLPVHTHPGLGTSKPFPGPGGAMIDRHDILAQVRFPLLCMILGGVFERHPGLKFVVTEAGVEWVPKFLEGLDGSLPVSKGAQVPNTSST